MGYVVKKHFDSIPFSSIIFDIGGCCGWYRRNLKKLRSDICIIIVNFMRQNLIMQKCIGFIYYSLNINHVIHNITLYKERNIIKKKIIIRSI